MRGNAPDSTTCKEACGKLLALATFKANAYKLKWANDSVSVILNYFRCYSYENGNNENVTSMKLADPNVQCDPGTTNFSLILIFIQILSYTFRHLISEQYLDFRKLEF